MADETLDAERLLEIARGLAGHPTPVDRQGRCWFCNGGLGHGPHGHAESCIWVHRDDLADGIAALRARLAVAEAQVAEVDAALIACQERCHELEALVLAEHGVLVDAPAEAVRERELRLAAEGRHGPVPDAYACQACGRRDGLDAVLPGPVWEQICGGLNLLCLWCIDRRCQEVGITVSASLHFAGLAITGDSQSDADKEHISRLVRQRMAIEARAERLAYWLKTYRDVIGVNAWRNGNASEMDAIDAALAEHDDSQAAPVVMERERRLAEALRDVGGQDATGDRICWCDGGPDHAPECDDARAALAEHDAAQEFSKT